MKCKTMILLIAVSATLASCAAPTYKKKPSIIRIVNLHNQTMTEFYGSHDSSKSWGNQILNWWVRNNTSYDIDFVDWGGNCVYDLKAVWADGTSSTKLGVNICTAMLVKWE